MRQFARFIRPSLVCSMLVLGGCETPSSDPYAALEPPPLPEALETKAPAQPGEAPVVDHTPPLSSDELERVAGTCRGELQQLYELRRQVPRPRLQEYAMTLGIASDSCTKLINLLSQARHATHWQRAYQLNLQHAQSTAEGGYGTDVTPLPQGTSGPSVVVESEPMTLR